MTKTTTRTYKGAAFCRSFVKGLITMSCWFEVMPLPFDKWEFTFKDESGLLREVDALASRLRPSESMMTLDECVKSGQHGLFLRSGTHHGHKIRCVKCSRIIRAYERLDFGDGTGQHIVCP